MSEDVKQEGLGFTEKETGESMAGKVITPAMEEVWMDLMAKVPFTTKDTLEAAGFPEVFIDRWAKMWKRPPIGKVHVATAREFRSNCSFVRFPDTDALNDWFSKHFGYILFDWKVNPDDGSIYAVIGNVLTPEESLDMEMDAEIVQELKHKRQQEREEKIQQYKKDLMQKRREDNELLALGKRCRDHHAPLLREVDELKKKVKKLERSK